MPTFSACWRARPEKDRRHVPVLRGWQQDSILPPLGIHKTMIIGRFCFVIIHSFNVTFRCLLPASWIKEHFAELFFEQTNISTNARPVRDTSVQFAFRSRNVVKRPRLKLAGVFQSKPLICDQYKCNYHESYPIVSKETLWQVDVSFGGQCQFLYICVRKTCICLRSLYQQTIVLQTIM